jgi:NADH-quinone oxidoreductase subunit C
MSLTLETLAKAFTGLMPEKPVPEPVPATPEAEESAVDAPAKDEAPAEPPAPVPPFYEQVDFNLRGFHLDATVLPGQVVPVASLLDEHGFAIDAVTGVDWIAEEQMEVVYDFFHPTEPWRVAARTRIPRAQPEIQTISEVFPGANWHERETHDFFGIRFLGHPDLSPFLLPEDADYHPLLKDFEA